MENRALGGGLIMDADERKAVFGVLDGVDRRLTDLLIEQTRSAGEQRTANAEFNGKLTLLGTQLANIEKVAAADKASTNTVIQQVETRVLKLEEKTSYYIGKTAGVAAIVSLVIAVVGLIIAGLGIK